MRFTFLFILAATLLLAGCSPYPDLAPMEYQDIPYPYQVKYADLNGGVRLAYVDEGSGDVPVIFIHGLGSYLPAWKKNIGELSRSHRTIAIDLPGYGKSSKDRYPFSIEFYADAVVELMNHLKIEKAVIAGHSMGGQTAIIAGLKYPNRVAKLILAAPAGFESFNEGVKEWFREVATVDLTRLTPTQQIRANVVSNFYNMPDDAEFMVTDRIALRSAKDFEGYCYAVAQSIKAMVNHPTVDVLSKIQQPTLIIFGEEDNLIPNQFFTGGATFDIAQIGAKAIPNNRLVMIPECGHFLQFEKPEAFNGAVLEFLAKD